MTKVIASKQYRKETEKISTPKRPTRNKSKKNEEIQEVESLNNDKELSNIVSNPPKKRQASQNLQSTRKRNIQNKQSKSKPPLENDTIQVTSSENHFSIENQDDSLPHLSISSITNELESENNSQKGRTYLTYTKIIGDTIEELKDLYIPRLLEMNIFSSTHEAELYFQTIKLEWIKKVEQSGAADSKPLTPYEKYLRKLKEENGEPVYRIDRAADFIHKKLSPSDYNSIALTLEKKNPNPGERIMNTLDMLQFGKPPKFLPANKKKTIDPAQRQEERHKNHPNPRPINQNNMNINPLDENYLLRLISGEIGTNEFNHETLERHSSNVSHTSIPITPITPMTQNLSRSNPNTNTNISTIQLNDQGTQKGNIIQVDGNDDDFDVKDESESDEELSDILIDSNAHEPNYLVSQYKIKPKTGKHKWKMTLVKAILHIDGKDELYSSIEANLQW